MTFSSNAKSGYAAAAIPVRTDRGVEYAAFANATRQLKSVETADRSRFVEVAHAVNDNSRLWGVLAADLMNDDNALPVPLRAQLLSLAQFVRKHSLIVLAGKASVEPLIDINTSIMRGLRGEMEEAA